MIEKRRTYHHNETGGTVSLDGKCNKVQRSWIYSYLWYGCGQALWNNEEILAYHQTFNVKFLGHASDLYSKWNKMLCLVDGRVVIWIYQQHLKVCCGTYGLSPRFLPHCCIFNFMSVRHGKHLSILLLNQASEHEEKNVPTPKGGKKSEIKRKKRKTYKPYLGFHSKQILYPTCKILPKKRAMVQTLNHQGTEKFTVDSLPICGATGSCCDKTCKSTTDIWINLSIV